MFYFLLHLVLLIGLVATVNSAEVSNSVAPLKKLSPVWSRNWECEKTNNQSEVNYLPRIKLTDDYLVLYAALKKTIRAYPLENILESKGAEVQLRSAIEEKSNERFGWFTTLPSAITNWAVYSYPSNGNVVTHRNTHGLIALTYCLDNYHRLGIYDIQNGFLLQDDSIACSTHGIIDEIKMNDKYIITSLYNKSRNLSWLYISTLSHDTDAGWSISKPVGHTYLKGARWYHINPSNFVLENNILGWLNPNKDKLYIQFLDTYFGATEAIELKEFDLGCMALKDTRSLLNYTASSVIVAGLNGILEYNFNTKNASVYSFNPNNQKLLFNVSSLIWCLKSGTKSLVSLDHHYHENHKTWVRSLELKDTRQYVVNPGLTINLEEIARQDDIVLTKKDFFYYSPYFYGECWDKTNKQSLILKIINDRPCYFLPSLANKIDYMQANKDVVAYIATEGGTDGKPEQIKLYVDQFPTKGATMRSEVEEKCSNRTPQEGKDIKEGASSASANNTTIVSDISKISTEQSIDFGPSLSSQPKEEVSELGFECKEVKVGKEDLKQEIYFYDSYTQQSVQTGSVPGYGQSVKANNNGQAQHNLMERYLSTQTNEQVQNAVSNPEGKTNIRTDHNYLSNNSTKNGSIAASHQPLMTVALNSTENNVPHSFEVEKGGIIDILPVTKTQNYDPENQQSVLITLGNMESVKKNNLAIVPYNNGQTTLDAVQIYKQVMYELYEEVKTREKILTYMVDSKQKNENQKNPIIKLSTDTYNESEELLDKQKEANDFFDKWKSRLVQANDQVPATFNTPANSNSNESAINRSFNFFLLKPLRFFFIDMPSFLFTPLGWLRNLVSRR